MNELVEQFHGELRKSYPTFAGIVERDYVEFGDSWADAFARSIEALFGLPGDERWSEALRGYVLFSMDAMKNQRFFEKHGRYAATSYDDLRRDYWDSPDFMLSNYLPGMFISYYLWPQHYRLLRFYDDKVMPRVSTAGAQTFCEVGTGTAMYSAATLGALPTISGRGYDISPHSLSFGKRVIMAFRGAERYELEQRDIVESPPDAVDYLICQEVLEHLADPATFVKALRSMVKPGGLAYITGAVTAGHSDHIYLFNTPDEVKAMLEAGGFLPVVEKTEQAESSNNPSRAPRIACYLCEIP